MLLTGVDAELGEHVVRFKLAEDAHTLRERIAVVGQHALRRENGPRESRRRFHGPE